MIKSIIKYKTVEEEIIIKYRGKKLAKLSSLSGTKISKKKTLDYFKSLEYQKKLENYNLNLDIFDEKNSEVEKIKIRRKKLNFEIIKHNKRRKC